MKSIVQSELNYTLSEEKVEIHPSSNIRFEDRQIYDPFDFSFAKKNLIKSQFHRDVGTNRPFNREGNRKEDVFKKHNINPLDLYTLSSVLRYYVNESGRIYHNNANIGVSQKSQKKLAKAIKRARVNAIMSNVSNITRIREG